MPPGSAKSTYTPILFRVHVMSRLPAGFIFSWSGVSL
jgi:hypothetical protein